MSKFAILFRRDRALLTAVVGAMVAGSMLVASYGFYQIARAGGQGSATIADGDEAAGADAVAEKDVLNVYSIVLTVGNEGITAGADNPRFSIPAIGLTTPDAVGQANNAAVNVAGEWSAEAAGGTCAVTIGTSGAAGMGITVDVTGDCAENDTITLAYAGTAGALSGATAVNIGTDDAAAGGGRILIAAPPTITVTDTTKPTVTSATLNYNNGVLVVTFNEQADASATDPTKFHLNDATGVDNVTLSAMPADVDGPTLTFTLTNAQREAALVLSGTAGGNGGAVVLDVDANGVFDMSANGNLIDDNNAVTETADTTAPTVVLASVTADPTNGLIAVTAEFSETVTLFVVGDVNLRNGAAQDFVAVDGNSYTFNVNPDAGGAVAVTIDVPATTSVDAAGNANAASNQLVYTSDDVAPTVAISDDQAGTAADADATVVYTFEFSETVTGFTDADMTVNAGGAKGAFTAVDGNTYTSLVTATDGSVADIDITAGNAGVIDAAGNALAAPANDATQTVDTTNPTVVLASVTANPTNGLIAVTAEFSEDVTLFVVGDVTVGNGAAQDFVPFDGNSYTFNVNPDAGGAVAVTIDVLATTSIDAAGNENAASNQLAYTSDDVAPTVVVTMDDAALFTGDTATVTYTFSEVPVNFTTADVTHPNATIDAITATGDPLVFTSVLTPDADIEDLSNVVAVGTAWQDAAGNTGVGDDSPNYEVDTAAPTVVVTMDDAALFTGDTATVTYTFSEVPVNFAVGDVAVGSGSIDAITATVDPLVFTSVLTPTAATTDATNVVAVGTAWEDAAGNTGVGDESPNYDVDTVTPTVVITDDEAGEVANIAGGSITYTFTFSEEVSGFVLGDIEVVNGTKAGAFATGEDGDAVYTLVITPEEDLEADLTVAVDAEVAADLAGNLSEAAEGSVQEIDTLAPTLETVLPEDGEESADRDDLIVLTFSESIEEDFDEDTQFTLLPDVSEWTSEVVDGNVVTLTHVSRLGCGDDYELALDTAAILDLNGNDLSLDEDQEAISFSTESCSGGGGGSSSSSSATSTAAVVTLTGPDAGDDLDGGDVETVTWTTSGSGNDTVGISYSTNAGVSFTQVAYDLDEDDGSYDWTVPNVSANDAIVKITSYDSNKGTLDTDTVTIDISSTEEVADEEEEAVGSTEGTTEDSEGRNVAPGSGEMGASPLDGSMEEISVVVAGQFVRAYGFPSVYYVNEDLSRSVFWDTNTFFTWADSWDNVVWVSNATLSTMTLGGAILPKPGVTLVKIQSDPKVYAIDEDGSGDSVLRWVPSEEVAIALYGSAWADYVIDIDSTVFSRFGAGSDMSSSSVVDRSIMKTRVAMAALAAGM